MRIIPRRRFLRGLSLPLGAAVGAWLIAAADYWLTRLRMALNGALPAALVAILPREAWSARPANHAAVNEYGFASVDNPEGWLVYQDDLRNIYHTVAIHHSAYPADKMDFLGVQALHQDTRGWADIGYHFGVDPDGVIYAGRDIGARGASVAGHNTGVIGVVALGDFEWEQPTAAQLSALQALICYLAATYQLTHLAGHGEFNPDTLCPGKYLKLYLDLLADGANLKRGTDGSKPSPEVSRLPACKVVNLPPV